MSPHGRGALTTQRAGPGSPISHPLRILYVDRDPLAAAAIEDILAKAGGFDLVTVEADARAAKVMCADHQPDVALIELFLGAARPDGIELSRALREVSPMVAVIICTASESPIDASRAWSAGVRSFVTKQQLLRRPEHIPFLLRSILDGAVVYCVDPRAVTPAGCLTEREMEVVRLKLGGSSHRRIAAELYVSVRTIDSHLANVRSKLGAGSIGEALRMAVDLGFASTVDDGHELLP